jgi:hypothetical protein
MEKSGRLKSSAGFFFYSASPAGCINISSMLPSKTVLRSRGFPLSSISDKFPKAAAIFSVKVV